MKVWIYNKSVMVFWLTLAIYALIWLTVSYIGVYVTYVAGPVLAISGLLALLTSPGDEATINC